MAAYAATVTNDDKDFHRVGVGLGIMRGSVDLTNYNTTLAELTGITGFFKEKPTVIIDGVSDNGYLGHWVKATGAIKCYYPTIASDQTPTADIVAAAGSQVVNDVDVGVFNFVAFGRV